MKKNIILFMMGVFIAITTIAQSEGIFPGEPFNGMQVNYKITGATITKYTDVPGFTWTRSLVISEIQKVGVLGISGSLKAGGLGCTVTVSVSAGANTSSKTYQVTPGTPMEFERQVTIPKDAKSASISINMDGHYSMGGGYRGVVVRGDWDGKWGSVTKPADPNKYKPKASPVARLKEILQRFSNAVPEGRAVTGSDNNNLSNFLEGYDDFKCGAYQGKAINLLDKLKFSNDPNERVLLDDYEYGPIQAQFGGHQAVVIYPKGSKWMEAGIVLDPWPTQKHPGTKITYTMAEWTKIFSPKGIDKCQLPGYKGLRFDGTYPDPHDTKKLPQEVMKWTQTLPQKERDRFAKIADLNERYYAIMNKYNEKEKNTKIVADCPLNVYIKDDYGRVSGFPGGIPTFEIPDVSMITFRLANGTYWTEIAFSSDNNYKAILKGTGTGKAAVYTGSNMQDEMAGRFVYKYSLNVSKGAEFEFDPQQDNTAIRVTRLVNKNNPVILGERINTSGYGERSITANTKKEEKIFYNGNIYGVSNGPLYSTKFVLTKPTFITRIENYHYFNNGTLPGTIALMSDEGVQFGPWAATGSPGQGGVQNANWIVKPNTVLPAGTYTVYDSDPATWSMNAQSGYKGFTTVWAVEQ